MSRRAPIASIRSGVAPGCCAAVYLSWSTGPRGRVCRPHAAWSASEIRRAPRMGPEAPVWAPVVCPTRRKPGARQPEQYALDPGIGQIPPDRVTGPADQQRHREQRHDTIRPHSAFLLQSKICRHDGHDQHVCGMETPFRPSRRQPAVFGGGDSTSSVFLLGAAARGANGAGPGRGAGTEVVHGIKRRAFTTGQIKRQRGGLSSPVIRCNTTVRALRDSLEHHEAAKYLEVRPRCQMLVTG